LIRLSSLILQQLRQTLLEPLEYFNVGKVLLRKPSRDNNTQLRFDGAEAMRPVTYHHDCLLYRAPSHVGGFVDKQARI
jgi:hypothetical protein